MNRRSLISRLFLTVALIAAIVFLAFQRQLFGATILEEKLRQFGPWGPLLFVLLYALGTTLFLPGSVLTVAGGALFGPLWGTLWNLTGATLGAVLAFVIARYIASAWVSERAGQRLARLIRGVEREGWQFVAFVRLVPLFPFNLVNYAFGLTQIRLGEYALASFVCMAPGAIAYTYLGYAGREAAAGSTRTVRNVLIALGLLATVMFLARLLRRSKKEGEFIDAAELKQRLKQSPQTIVIDVREREEFDGALGHISGSQNIALKEIFADTSVLSQSRNVPIVMVCKTDKRSAKAAELMRQRGFQNVSILRDGVEGWKRTGFPLEHRKAACLRA